MAGCIQVVGEAAQDQDQLEGTTIVPAGETAQDRPQVLCEGIQSSSSSRSGSHSRTRPEAHDRPHFDPPASTWVN